MNSIRKRVMLRLVPLSIGALLATELAETWDAHKSVEANFDHHLKHTALMLRDRSTLTADLPGQIASETDQNLAATQVYVQIRDAAAGLSASSPGFALPLAATGGHHHMHWDERDWEVYTIVQPQRTIQVSQPASVRDAAVRSVTLRRTLPFMFVCAALIAIAWWTIGHGLKPLHQLAEQIRRRKPGALEPLPTAQLGPDLSLMAHELNALLARLNHAHNAQDAFVADAAHELRSPLTALRLQLQLLERAGSDAGRSETLANLHSSVARLSVTVAQLLQLARWDPEAPHTSSATDLNRIAKSVVGELSALAEARNVDLGLAQSEAQVVEGEPEALHTMLANLVDNAVRYTPEGGRVDVNVRHLGKQALLEVIDTGPGIEPAERERVFDRFYRTGRSDTAGSGLGLAIVKRIVQRHGANIEIGAGVEGKGLRVAVAFPASAA